MSFRPFGPMNPATAFKCIKNDVEIRNLIIDILSTNKTIGDIRYSLQNILNEEAVKYADQEFSQYEDYIW